MPGDENPADPVPFADTNFADRSKGSDSSGATPDSAMTAEHKRAGVDLRQRGWFWHWNSIVTQYAPLIGLKGVGLLNSYTVWTDRREESPHRGYAFPSQQSEADFYGEERSELITINKILVALDLIEIRKEMIQRVDERGRKWRVPHNLYRVKDRPDGTDLRASDVLRVTELARDDAAVYRYVRRVFSPRFKPIDRDNIWHAILLELADHPAWREMQERTIALESRASARTRAGHKTRSARDEGAAGENNTRIVLTNGHLSRDALYHDEHHDSVAHLSGSIVAESNTAIEEVSTCVAPGNSAFEIVVAATNDGSTVVEASVDDGSNRGRLPDVEPSNTTYHQAPTTTTTTTDRQEDATGRHPATGVEPIDHLETTRPSNRSPVTNNQFSEPVDAADTSASTDVRLDARGDHEHLAPGKHTSRNSRSGTGGVAPEDTSSGEMSSHRAGGDQAGEARASGGQAVSRTEATGDHPGAGVATQWSGESTGPAAPQAPAAGKESSREGNGLHEEERTTRGALAAAGTATADTTVENERDADGQRPGRPRASGTTGVRGLADGGAGGPLGDPSPLVVSLFEAANDRRSTALERILLAELERDADAPARAVGVTGSDWVAAALREAVASGSAFVAPKRIREIVNRWAHERAWPGDTQQNLPATTVQPLHATEPADQSASALAPAGMTGDVARQGTWPPADVPLVRLPGGATGGSVWATVLQDLSSLLDTVAFERLLAGSIITRFWRGTVEVQVASSAVAEKLSAEYRALIERHLNARLPRAVSVRFHAAVPLPPPASDGARAVTEDIGQTPALLEISTEDRELASRVWQAILSDLAAAVPANDLDGLAQVVPLGEDAHGMLLLGAPTARAARLIDGRCRIEVERALSAFLGRSVSVRAVASSSWAIRDRV